MSDYQRVKIVAVEDGTLRLRVHERHPEMAELARVLDNKGNVRKSMARRLANFAAGLLLDYNDGSNSFTDLLQCLVDLDVAPDYDVAARRVISSVELAGLTRLGDGSGGPLYRADITITSRSALVFRSFRVGKSHDAAASLDGDIELV